MPTRPSSAIPWLGALLGGLAALLLVMAIAGIPSSFSDPDESAHYVNALFLGDWLRAGLPPPMAFAHDYYAHFPKLSIGHWPPGWYALLAPGFALSRPSPFAALVLSAFVAGLPAGFILWATERASCRRIGMAAAASYLLLPLVIDGARHFLLDQPVAVVVGLGAIAWAGAAERPTWLRLLAFAALAAAASLTKGNGALIALVPALDILIWRRWALLKLPALWVSGAAALAVVAPWYWLSFHIAAGGFNFAPGASYAWLALSANLRSIIANIGWCGVALALAAGAGAWRERNEKPDTARVAGLALTVVIATLLFQSAVPAALEPRYMTPLLPWLIVLEAIGVAAMWRRPGKAARAAAFVLVLGAAIPGVSNLAGLRLSTDIGAPAIAAAMDDRPGVWLVDGRAGGEGAVIAAAAFADNGANKIWIARASQWLSTSDFMGRDYRVTARTPAEARAVADRIGASGVISIRDHGRLAYPHSRPLGAMAVPPDFRRRIAPFRTGEGNLLIATRIAAVQPAATLLRSGPGSTGLASLAAVSPPQR